MKEVSKEEFETFIKNYPRKLDCNFFMDWLEYYDFPCADFKPKNLEELYSYKVARHYLVNEKYYIKA